MGTSHPPTSSTQAAPYNSPPSPPGAPNLPSSRSFALESYPTSTADRVVAPLPHRVPRRKRKKNPAMVSFSCEGCGDVLTKKKLDPHRNQCYGASFTCLDCMVHFQGTDYRSHTSCISEAQKYQGALYRPEKGKKATPSNPGPLVPHKAYVEDADEDSRHNSKVAIVEPQMPEAPSPPSAAPDFGQSSSPPGPVNVFDFLVEATPNASKVELLAPEPMQTIEDAPGRRDDEDDHEEDTSRSLVRVHFDQAEADVIQYGNGPVASAAYQTPAPKEQRERREKKKDREHKVEKKDKKRKRLHVETHDLNPRDADETMTDAPPVLHSGLTGGLNRLLRPSVFPPSPDYSGGDAGDASPGSPIKKTKHSKKRGRVETIGNGIMSLITTSKSRDHSEDRPKRKHRKHRESSERPAPKMIEYKPINGEAKDADTNQMIVFKSRPGRADHLLSFISKGPDSDRGISMNKALKRYHRERLAMGGNGTKTAEEKELWKSLRMKRNDRGEIVLFI